LFEGFVKVFFGTFELAVIPALVLVVGSTVCPDAFALSVASFKFIRTPL